MIQKITLSILLAIFVTSCGTSSKKMEKPDEFPEIRDSDFVAPAPVVLNPTSDFYALEEGDKEFKETLGGETLSIQPNDATEVVIDSDNPINQVLGFCYKKQFQKAYGISDSIFRKYKKNPSYWNAIGTCHLLNGESKKALLYYNKSRETNVNFAPPVNNLGVILQQQGKDQRALKAYKSAADMASFSLTPLYNQGQLFLKYGLLDNAQKVFTAILGKNPEDVGALNAMGYLNLLEGNNNRAIGFYSKIDRDRYRDPKIGLNVVMTLLKLNKTSNAKDVFAQVRSDGSSYYSKVQNLLARSK
tara:strand:- start:169095 stop:170000 length:906 start_codon:yes stop_codon:yes gene_type:complete